LFFYKEYIPQKKHTSW